MHELPEKRWLYGNHITNYSKTCLVLLTCLDLTWQMINWSQFEKLISYFIFVLVEHEKTGFKANWFGELDNFLLFFTTPSTENI